MASETVTASERIYNGKIINVRQDTVRFENGKTGTRDIVEHRGAIAVLPMVDADHVILVSQYRSAVGRVLVEIPAGTLNVGEEVEICAHREIIEEIQQKAGKLEKLFSMFVAPGYSNELIHVFVATELTPHDGIGDDDEFIELRTVSLTDALKMVMTGEIEDAKTIAGLLAVARQR